MVPRADQRLACLPVALILPGAKPDSCPENWGCLASEAVGLPYAVTVEVVAVLPDTLVVTTHVYTRRDDGDRCRRLPVSGGGAVSDVPCSTTLRERHITPDLDAVRGGAPDLVLPVSAGSLRNLRWA